MYIVTKNYLIIKLYIRKKVSTFLFFYYFHNKLNNSSFTLDIYIPLSIIQLA